MEPELKLQLNETGKYRSEYLTFALQNLSKLDSYKDQIFNNINKNIMSRVDKLQNLKSRINRIRAILPKLNECNNAMTIKSKKYYPMSKHNYYKYINLEEKPEEISNLINTNYNCNNPNIPIINIKKPLVEKPENTNTILGKIPRETLDDCISSQLISNMQKKVDDLASELYNLRFKNIGTSLVNELNDLVYEKTNYLGTSFGFMNKKLIQKADLLWKIDKEEIDLNHNDEKEDKNSDKNSNKRLPAKLQEAPKSIITKAKIEKYVNKKVLLEKTEKIEVNLPTTINLIGVAELKDEVQNEELQNADENILPEREEDFDNENLNDINNIILDEDIDFQNPLDIITSNNLANLKNDGNINITPSKPNYSYQTANTSNINNTSNNINININNNNINSAPQAPTTISSGNIVVVSGKGPRVPPPPPPPSPPPVVPVVKKAVVKKAANGEGNEEDQKAENEEEPKRELSMAEQLATIKLKKVGTYKSKEPPKKKQTVNHNDLLKQQIMLRFQKLKLHEEKNDEEEEENEDDF